MSRHQDYEGHEHLPLAYRNRDFLDGPEGRSLRILSEYLYPLSHFRTGAGSRYGSVLRLGAADGNGSAGALLQ